MPHDAQPYDFPPLTGKARDDARALLHDTTMDHEKLVTFLNGLGRLNRQITITNYNADTKDVRFVIQSESIKTSTIKDIIKPHCVSVSSRPIYSMRLDEFINRLIIPHGGKTAKAKPPKAHHAPVVQFSIPRTRRKPLTQEMIDTIEDTIETLDLPLALVNPEAGSFQCGIKLVESAEPLDPRLLDVLKKYAHVPEHPDMRGDGHFRIASDDVPHLITVLDLMLDERLNGKPDTVVKKINITYDLKPLLAPTEDREAQSLTKISYRCRKALLDIQAATPKSPRNPPTPFYMIQRDVYRYGSTLDHATDTGALLALPSELKAALEPINIEPVKRYGQITIDMRKNADTLIDTLNSYVNGLEAEEAKRLYDAIKDSVSVETQKAGKGGRK